MQDHRDGPAQRRVVIRPSGLAFSAAADEDLLSAARRQGLAVRHACRNGVCDVCDGRLLVGEVLNTRNGERLLPESRVLLCRAQARADCEFWIGDLMEAGQLPSQTLSFRVRGIVPLNHDVYQVKLMPPPGRRPAFHAGQYMGILLPDQEPAWFSLASAPSVDEVELHIQASPDWTSAQRVIEYLRDQPTVQVQMPMGRACLAAVPEAPLVLVVAGTGFAQAKSVLEYLFVHGLQAQMTLYWGVRRQEDMYLRQLAEDWAQRYPLLRFVPVLGDQPDNDWPGHHEQLVKAVLADRHDWTRARVLASGSPGMVYTLLDALQAEGLPEAHFLSDVLEYAPRG